MDARLDPAKVLGISEGESHVIRNAGGRTVDALRSIVISQQLLGTREIVIVHHVSTSFKDSRSKLTSWTCRPIVACSHSQMRYWGARYDRISMKMSTILPFYPFKMSDRALLTTLRFWRRARWCWTYPLRVIYMMSRPVRSTRLLLEQDIPDQRSNTGCFWRVKKIPG